MDERVTCQRCGRTVALSSLEFVSGEYVEVAGHADSQWVHEGCLTSNEAAAVQEQVDKVREMEQTVPLDDGTDPRGDEPLTG